MFPPLVDTLVLIVPLPPADRVNGPPLVLIALPEMVKAPASVAANEPPRVSIVVRAAMVKPAPEALIFPPAESTFAENATIPVLVPAKSAFSNRFIASGSSSPPFTLCEIAALMRMLRCALSVSRCPRGETRLSSGKVAAITTSPFWRPIPAVLIVTLPRSSAAIRSLTWIRLGELVGVQIPLTNDPPVVALVPIVTSIAACKVDAAANNRHGRMSWQNCLKNGGTMDFMRGYFKAETTAIPPQTKEIQGLARFSS